MNAFCINCGHKIEEGIKFCPNCGKPVLRERTIVSSNKIEEEIFKIEPTEVVVKSDSIFYKHRGKIIIVILLIIGGYFSYTKIIYPEFLSPSAKLIRKASKFRKDKIDATQLDVGTLEGRWVSEDKEFAMFPEINIYNDGGTFYFSGGQTEFILRTPKIKDGIGSGLLEFLPTQLSRSQSGRGMPGLDYNPKEDLIILSDNCVYKRVTPKYERKKRKTNTEVVSNWSNIDQSNVNASKNLALIDSTIVFNRAFLTGTWKCYSSDHIKGKDGDEVYDLLIISLSSFNKTNFQDADFDLKYTPRKNNNPEGQEYFFKAKFAFEDLKLIGKDPELNEFQIALIDQNHIKVYGIYGNDDYGNFIRNPIYFRIGN